LVEASQTKDEPSRRVHYANAIKYLTSLPVIFTGHFMSEWEIASKDPDYKPHEWSHGTVFWIWYFHVIQGVGTALQYSLFALLGHLHGLAFVRQFRNCSKASLRKWNLEAASAFQVSSYLLFGHDIQFGVSICMGVTTLVLGHRTDDRTGCYLGHY
jgi:hypothetical protein